MLSSLLFSSSSAFRGLAYKPDPASVQYYDNLSVSFLVYDNYKIIFTVALYLDILSTCVRVIRFCPFAINSLIST
jgi:hypothetical protein